MCGITLTITPHSHTAAHQIHHQLVNANSARGPDAQSTYTTTVQAQGGDVTLCLSSSVLGLRGALTAQPLVGKRGVLAWNGQVFGGLGVDRGDNDTRIIFDRLETGEDVHEVLASIEGPYAFIYYEHASHLLTYQVDLLSRRSLLVHPASGINTSLFALTSTRSDALRQTRISFRALGGGEGGTLDVSRLVVNAEQEAAGSSSSSTSKPFLDCRSAWTPHHEHVISGPYTRLPSLNPTLPTLGHVPSSEAAVAEAPRFLSELEKSVQRRVDNIPAQKDGRARAALLFSGGVDSVLLAYMLHRCLPSDEPIDLINVAFQRAPARIDPYSKTARKGKGKAPDEGPAADPYATPDRLAGLDALEELQECCEGREFNFVAVDVTTEDYQSHRARVIDLMYPSTTEMDLSLALPLYFASRGIGTVSGREYRVMAKVYLTGLGPDEQLGGYARHRRAYLTPAPPLTPHSSLLAALSAEIASLPTRNTARDDRLLASHARDARFPFLDLDFVRYLASVPVWAKAVYELGEGVGDKILLREATRALGMVRAASRVKRAMQFGSRSAKAGGEGAGAGVGTGGKRGKGVGAREICVE